MRLSETFIQKRFCAEHTEIGKRAAAEQDGVRSDEAIIANSDGGRRLPTLLDIDRVRDDLRLESRHRRKLTNGDRIRAVDQMPMGNGGVLAKD